MNISPTTNNKTDLQEGLIDNLKAIFAKITRYPTEILEPEALLEEDLGIDSVKLGEVFSVIREQYHLPKDLTLPADDVKSIAAISKALAVYTKETHTTIETTQPNSNVEKQVVPEPVNHAKISTEQLTETVKGIFAKVTRYPIEILEPEALLEEDLGIDSVKLGEVFSVIREQFNLPKDLTLTTEQVKSIAAISKGLAAYIGVQGQTNAYNSEPNNASASMVAKVKPVIQQAATEITDKHQPLKGKIAFISGSGRGLGRVLAMHLSDLGATVIINSFHSRNQGEQTAKDIKARDGKAVHIWGSMAKPDHVNSIFDEIEERFGHLDFFISNASNGKLAKLEDITAEDWEKAFRTVVIGLHLGAQRAVNLMKKQGGGKIITLSSLAAHTYVDYYGCMGAIKAAVESLTRSMAVEFAPFNVQVNCVSPGPIHGKLLDSWPESEKLVERWKEKTSTSRLCKPEDVAQFISYLLSDSAQLFNGSVLTMDGGIGLKLI